MAVGDRIDWGGDSWGQSKRLAKSSFSGLLARDKSPRSKSNNNKDTGYVVRGGGSANQRTAAGLSGLKKTLVDRPVNLQGKRTGVTLDDGGMNAKSTQWVVRGGGVPPRSVVQAKPNSVKVRPVK